jgi:hypothetical protein
MMTHALKRISRCAAAVLAPLLTVLALGGCSGSSGEATLAAETGGSCTSGTSAECGTVLIAITDADGDFVSYSVDVQAVTLHRTGGARDEALPATARVDFAALADLSELLSAATIACHKERQAHA